MVNGYIYHIGNLCNNTWLLFTQSAVPCRIQQTLLLYTQLMLNVGSGCL
jgi:hypothetical protein